MVLSVVISLETIHELPDTRLQKYIRDILHPRRNTLFVTPLPLFLPFCLAGRLRHLSPTRHQYQAYSSCTNSKQEHVSVASCQSHFVNCCDLDDIRQPQSERYTQLQHRIDHASRQALLLRGKQGGYEDCHQNDGEINADGAEDCGWKDPRPVVAAAKWDECEEMSSSCIKVGGLQ